MKGKLSRICSVILAFAMTVSLLSGFTFNVSAAELTDVTFEEIYDSTLSTTNYARNMAWDYFSTASRTVEKNESGLYYALRRYANGQTCYFIYDALKMPDDSELTPIRNKSFEVYTIQEAGNTENVVVEYSASELPPQETLDAAKNPPYDDSSVTEMGWTPVEIKAGEPEQLTDTRYRVTYTSVQPLPEDARYFRIRFTDTGKTTVMYEGIKIVTEATDGSIPDTPETELFEHKLFMNQDWQDYFDSDLSKELDKAEAVGLAVSSDESYPRIEGLRYNTYGQATPQFEFVYSVNTINVAANKNYTAFSDYNVAVSINGGDANNIQLSYSADGTSFIPLTIDTDYSVELAALQPADYPDFLPNQGDKNNRIYELKAKQALPEGTRYFKIVVPSVAARSHAVYAGASFNMVKSGVEIPSYDWPAGAQITSSLVTTNSATLTWPAIEGAEGDISYVVTRTGGAGQDQQTLTDLTVSYTGLMPGTTYNVSIEAMQDGRVVSSAPLTGQFTTMNAAEGEAYAMADTFDDPDDLLSDMVAYGWGDIYKSDGTEYNGGAPLNAGSADIFAQQTVNIGTADEPQNINVLARQNSSTYNKQMYVVYAAENLTSFVAEVTLGMYKNAYPTSDGITFWTSSSDDPTDYTSFTQLNAVAVQEELPTENGTARVNTYMSNSIPDGTKYLRVELRNPTNAEAAAMNQVGLKKIKLNFNAKRYTIGEITETAKTDDSVTVSWMPDSNDALTYYLLQDYTVVKTISGDAENTYTASGLQPGLEYRFSLVVMDQRGDAEADLSANFVEHRVTMEEDEEYFIDRFKFADNMLEKMDQDTMTEESAKANNTNLFRHNAGDDSIFRKDVNQDGIVVYHVPDMTGFTIDFSLAQFRDSLPEPLEFYVAGEDKNFQPVTVSPASFTDPNDDKEHQYDTWSETVNSVGTLPEGTEYLKIVFGKSRVDCEKMQQIKIFRKVEYDYQWEGGAAAPTQKELTDTSATITWPDLADPKPAAYAFDVYRNGIKVETVTSDIKEYTFTDLNPGTAYSFGVQAVDSTDDSKTSSRIELNLDTYAREDIWGGNIVTFEDYTDTSVTLVLPEVPDATVQKYIIRNDQDAVVAEVTDGNRYTVSGLTTGAAINYTVQAVVDQSGTTRYTTLLLASTVLDPSLENWPTGSSISLSNLSESGVTLSWGAFGDMTGRQYSVAVNGEVKATTTDTTYTLTELTPETSYDLTVTVVDGAGTTVSHSLAVRFSTLRVTGFFTNFRAADLTYADSEDWELCDFYETSQEVPNVVYTNKVTFEKKINNGDPLGPVWSGYKKSDNSNAADAYIIYDAGEPLSEIVVRTQHNDDNKGAVEQNRPRIEYALDDGKAQSAQGSFDPNAYTWTEVDYSHASMELIGNTGEYNASTGERKTDNEILETTVSQLPAGARYFRIYVPNISNSNHQNWRQWIVGVGGELYDVVEAALRAYDFNNALTNGDTMDNVSHDVNLPSEISGYRVEWTSNNETLIGADGTHHTENITEGYYGGEVTFTATIYRYPGDSEPVASQDYTVQVYKNTDGWTPEQFIDYDLQQFTDVNEFTAPQPANALAVDVETPLPTGVEGSSSFSWSIKEDTEYARIEDGKLLITQKLGEDVPLTLVLTATKDGVSKTREYPINVIQSFGTPISDGRIEVSSGTGKDNVKSVGFGEYWASVEGDTNPYVQYKLDGDYTFMTVVLGEVGDSVQSFRLMTSEDGTEWTTVYTGGTLGNAKQFPVALSQLTPQYFRAEFTPMAGSTVQIAEFLLFEEPLTEEQVIESTFSLIDLPKSTSTDLELITEGIDGAVISWDSSDPDIISETGEITRSSESQTVTLTATVTYNGVSESREYNVTVLRLTSGSGGNGGGGNYGGGSSGSGSGSGNGLPFVPDNDNIQPDQNPDMQDSIYSDLEKTHWAYGYIKTLTDKNIVSGAGDGNFYPENSVTREEFLKMLLSAMNVQVTASETDFADVDNSAWYAPYVATAYELGIVKGIDEATFGIGTQISRQDMAVMADRLLKAEGISSDGAELTYTDASDIANYAVESVSALAALNVMNGNENNQFLPAANATRAEAAKIVYVIANMAE